jgi:hypothetical protein
MTQHHQIMVQLVV